MTRLMLGDCLGRMAEIEDGSVDLIACDLPYGTTANRWDVVIPFEPLWAHYRRIIKPRGAIVLNAAQPFTSILVLSNLDWFKYCLVWEKNRLTNFYSVKYQPARKHEDLVVFSPAASTFSRRCRMTYNPLMAPGAPWLKRRGHPGPKSHRFHSPKRPGLFTSQGGRHPSSVMKYAVETGLHPTQKPLPMMTDLVRTYSNPGDTVLDNCMGSGTTGVAALNTGRRFIGIERDPDYFETAKRRIAEAEKALAS